MYAFVDGCAFWLLSTLQQQQKKLDKKVCEQTLSWLAKAGQESFKKF